MSRGRPRNNDEHLFVTRQTRICSQRDATPMGIEEEVTRHTGMATCRWWRCPGCHRRARYLYRIEGEWLCWRCGDLIYPATRQDATALAIGRVIRLWRSLRAPLPRDAPNGDPVTAAVLGVFTILGAIPPRAYLMRRDYYNRRVLALMQAQAEALRLLGADLTAAEQRCRTLAAQADRLRD